MKTLEEFKLPASIVSNQLNVIERDGICVFQVSQVSGCIWLEWTPWSGLLRGIATCTRGKTTCLTTQDNFCTKAFLGKLMLTHVDNVLHQATSATWRQKGIAALNSTQSGPDHFFEPNRSFLLGLTRAENHKCHMRLLMSLLFFTSMPKGCAKKHLSISLGLCWMMPRFGSNFAWGDFSAASATWLALQKL